ncbi:MAG: peptidase [Flavobacteriales bacterium]|nr:peptidase [Flavobacteriales bacterium]|tara:strand:+ start:357 stop:1181 length:825 start_codon:yes stop_codon:yes gene_type:complete
MSELPEIRINKGLIGTIAVVIIIFVVLYKSAVTLGAGEAGVVFKPFAGGVDTETTLGEGFHIIMPWNKVVTYDVRQQEEKEKMQVLSSNGLQIDIDISIWYRPDVSKLPQLHQEKGERYKDIILKPAMRSAMRSVVGRYTPEEIYSSKRDAIQSEIMIETKSILESQYIIMERALVRDIALPPTIKSAIEKKLKQEQESLEYEFKLNKQKKEAERLKIEAEGKAEANRILSASLTDKILKEKGIEATLELSKSPNSKVVVVGGSEGMPLILGNN